MPERPSGEPGWTRWLPALLVPLALACDLGAALPTRSYFFRDFTVTFLPLRLFVAHELRALRFPFWNPYVFEGTFQLPTFYPADLLHVLWPSPIFVSWLLTLHLALAALAAYWLARELGAPRVGGFVAGCVFALGGFALSCLNLYVFLQALALAPFVVGLLRRAALGAAHRIVVASVVLAVATSTLAVEFVAQAVLLGVALGLAEAGARSLPRLALSVALGIGLCGVPIAVLIGLLPESARGAGFTRDVALGNAVHPVVLLQLVMPRLFGLAAAPAEAWWGGRFFSKGTPYFLSLYCGPLALALAALGLPRLRHRVGLVIGVASALGLWYALGALGGLAPLAFHLPLVASFRFPSKALLLPHLGLALAAGFGAARLWEEDRWFARLAGLTGGIAGFALAVLIVLALAPAGLVAWTGVRPMFWPALLSVAAGDAASCGLVALATVALALAVRRRLVRSGPAVALVVAILAADLVHAGTGLNRQVAASFFDLLPELAALPLRDPDGGRVFSYGLDRSPAFQKVLATGGRELTLGSFFASRQALVPYTNMLDRIESPEGKDLTAFAPRQPELSEESYEPARVGGLVPWLRNAAVSRVLSADRLVHPDLSLLGVVPTGLPGLAVHAYRLEGSWPRTYVACRALEEPDAVRALLCPYGVGFDPRRDVALPVPAAESCRKGEVWGRGAAPGFERFETKADGAGYLVVRVSYARGWQAEVDGRRAPVLRADGKHLAVPLPAGRHDLELRYVPPGLTAGIALFGGSTFVSLALLVRRGEKASGRRKRPLNGSHS
jgi:hypothetical protein